MIGIEATMVEVLRRRAREEREAVAITFLSDGEHHQAHTTYGALDDRATTLAQHLAARFEAGARVLLVFPPGPVFLTGFFGCLYAGLVAVPVAPPRPNGSLTALESIARDCGTEAAATTGRFREALRPRIALHPGLAPLAWIDAAETFAARLSDGDGPFLRTGDQ